MDLKRRLQLYLVGLIIGGVAAYFMLGDRLVNGAWTPEHKLKQRLRSTLIKASPSAAERIAAWPTDLAALRRSLDSASVDLGASRRTDDSIYYSIDTRIAGRAAHLTVGVLRDFDRDSTATLMDLRPVP
ncbi:MAG TPA: hypothetical protein VKG92_09550 [Flavobacteriales bacterium]|nr:hypothetical protein [Flavobacteriales bacterium]